MNDKIRVILERDNGVLIPCIVPDSGYETEFDNMAEATKALKWYQAGWPSNKYYISVEQ